jgi:bacterial/archaeal transporter family-2 protein
VTQHGPFWPLAALMLATGIGIPVFAALNTGLSQQLGSTVAATWITYLLGLILASGMLLVTGLPEMTRVTFDKPYLYLGVVFLLFYILSITFAAPRIGIGNAVFFVLLGQLIAAAAIDHFGWLGSLKFEITGRRVLGIAVMVLGVYLARKPI